MAITYKKNKITKDRSVMPTGPRDRQRRLQLQQAAQDSHNELIEELRNQISELKDKLSSRPVQQTASGWTDDKVNAEIMRAIKDETSDLKAQFKQEKEYYIRKLSKLEEDLHETSTKNKLLEKDIDVLNEKLSEKNRIISDLKANKPEIDNNVTALLAEATKKIEDLTTRMSMAGSQAEIISGEVGIGRPKMETVFVDPIENSESKVEKHFDVEDVSISKKDEMASKVGKLKNLLGSLPSKR